MSWKTKYKVVRIVPGPIVAPWGEKIDLTNPNIPEDKIERLIKEGCPYLQLADVPVKTEAKKPNWPPAPDFSTGHKKKS